MSSDIRLEDDRVTVEGKLDVDDGASIRGDIALSGPRILGDTKIAGFSPPTPSQSPSWEDVIEISSAPRNPANGFGVVTVTVGDISDTLQVQRSQLILRSQIASISVGFGDDDDAYTQIRNNIVYAKDFVQHENGSLIEKLKELEGKIDKLEDRIRQLEGQS